MLWKVLTVAVVGVGAYWGYKWYKGYQDNQQRIATAQTPDWAKPSQPWANCPAGMICGAPFGIRVL